MNEQQQLDVIKTQMPETYRSIQDKAGEIGPLAYRLVRQGLRGEANSFYAIEAGQVVGTPFNGRISAEVAQLIVGFGMRHVIFWPDVDSSARSAHGKA